MSKLETHIMNILYKENISYEREKTFYDLGGGKFRFDFYLPDLNYVLEINGMQHYKNIYNDRQKFLKGQEHDRRKISYCLANNINIYLIPEWDIYSISTFEECIQDEYLARSRWHNDQVYNRRIFLEDSQI